MSNKNKLVFLRNLPTAKAWPKINYHQLMSTRCNALISQTFWQGQKALSLNNIQRINQAVAMSVLLRADISAVNPLSSRLPQYAREACEVGNALFSKAHCWEICSLFSNTPRAQDP
jgi:hypothetical protein